jgi:hypothetical protein
LNKPGVGNTNETIIQRLKREKRERENKAQKQRENIDQRKAESHRAGRDTFDKDLDDISYDTLEETCKHFRPGPTYVDAVVAPPRKGRQVESRSGAATLLCPRQRYRTRLCCWLH